MNQNSKGWYCSTPITKSADGKEVLEWCKWQPEKADGVAAPNSTITREPITQRDYAEEARGKIRSLFIQAHITKNGMVPLNGAELMTLDSLVEVAMGTK